jgi:hypothetical protein
MIRGRVPYVQCRDAGLEILKILQVHPHARRFRRPYVDRRNLRRRAGREAWIGVVDAQADVERATSVGQIGVEVATGVSLVAGEDFLGEAFRVQRWQRTAARAELTNSLTVTACSGRQPGRAAYPSCWKVVNLQLGRSCIVQPGSRGEGFQESRNVRPSPGVVVPRQPRVVVVREDAYFGCATVRKYGLSVLKPCGYFFLASSSDTAGGMMTSCPGFQLTGVATVCFAVN